MASLRDLINKFEGARDNLDLALLDTATSVSLAGKQYSERIISDEGFGAFYSDTKYPAFLMYGEELTLGGLAYLENKADKKELTNWKGLRDAQGLQTSFVDLHYSNKMFESMLPRDSFQDGTKYLAPLASSNTEGQNKMNWNRDRYGDFIGKALGEDGKELMGTVGLAELERFLKSYGI